MTLYGHNLLGWLGLTPFLADSVTGTTAITFPTLHSHYRFITLPDPVVGTAGLRCGTDFMPTHLLQASHIRYVTHYGPTHHVAYITLVTATVDCPAFYVLLLVCSGCRHTTFVQDYITFTTVWDHRTHGCCYHTFPVPYHCTFGPIDLTPDIVDYSALCPPLLLTTFCSIPYYPPCWIPTVRTGLRYRPQ